MLANHKKIVGFRGEEITAEQGKFHEGTTLLV